MANPEWDDKVEKKLSGLQTKWGITLFSVGCFVVGVFVGAMFF